MAKHKFASISLTVRDRVIRRNFRPTGYLRNVLCNFQKIFPFSKMAAILNFRIFVKNFFFFFFFFFYLFILLHITCFKILLHKSKNCYITKIRKPKDKKNT